MTPWAIECAAINEVADYLDEQISHYTERLQARVHHRLSVAQDNMSSEDVDRVIDLTCETSKERALLDVWATLRAVADALSEGRDVGGALADMMEVSPKTDTRLH